MNTQTHSRLLKPEIMDVSLQDPKSFLNAICSPHVAPFLSRERLVKSEQFLDLMNHCDQHFDAYRDTKGFSRLLSLFNGYPSLAVLADYLRARHGVQVIRVAKTIKIVVPKGNTASEASTKKMTFAKYFGASKEPTVLVAAKKSGSSTVPKKLAQSKDVWKEGYVDALDHPARLPGSFGHGRGK